MCLVPTNLVAPPTDSSPKDVEEWTHRVDIACTEILRQCVKHERSIKHSNISSKINARLIEHILSMEEGGSSSGFLRRAAFNGTTQSGHVQATLPKGGASVEPSAVKNGLHSTYQDWFAPRKHGPGGSAGPGRPDILEIYEGLDGRIQAGSDKCVAHNITLQELKDSLQAAAANTCPGPSGVSIALLKLLPEPYLEDLCGILNLILQWGILPECFDLGYIFPIPKKGTFTPENSRPISLLEVHMKLLTRIINRRLVYSLVDEGYFSEAQFGFHPGRSCPDAFHILLATIEDAAERNREIHVCLVDLTKAFDSLSPESLRQSYKHAGLSDKSVKFLGAMDGTGKAQVLTPFGPTKLVDLKWGVRQGEVLSPLKFITWLNPWLEYAFRKFPDAGYKMEDGTRVLLLAYADDIAIVTSNQQEMQEIMDSLCDFLKYHGVTLSADEKVSKSKTKYISHNPAARPSDPAPRIAISCYNRDSRKGDQKRPNNIILKSLGKSYIFVYLGGRLSLDLDWKKITALSAKGISRELNRLKRKNLTLSEAAAVASSVILGKAGYLLQLAQFPLHQLKSWDASLNGCLLRKVGAALGASPAMLHADQSEGGMGIFTFAGLALQSGATELLVRLNSSGVAGQAARCRFNAALKACPQWHHADGTIPSNTRKNFTLYTILRLRRLGYTLIGPTNKDRVEKHFRHGTRLCDYLAAHPVLLADLESKGFNQMEDLFHKEGGVMRLRPWIEVKRTYHDQPCAWYKALQAVPDHIVAVGFKDSRLSPDQYGPISEDGSEASEESEEIELSDIEVSECAPQVSALSINPPSPLRLSALAPTPLDCSPVGILLRNLSAQLLKARSHRALDIWKLSPDNYQSGVRRRERRGKLMQTLKAAIMIVHHSTPSDQLQNLLELITNLRNEVKELTTQETLNRLTPQALPSADSTLPLWELDACPLMEEEVPEEPLVEEVPPPLHHWILTSDIPPGPGPDDSLFFATDGSVDESKGKGGYSSVTPHTLEGWAIDVSGKYSSKERGVSCYGAEKVAVDTCELMAVVDVLENAPQENLTLLVDASYIMYGFHAHPSGLRRQIRNTNRPLWLRAREALTQRHKAGLFVRFRKCSSHNKDPNQHPLITLWNDRADEKAKAGCGSANNCLHEWTPDGDFSFQMLFRGKLVRGDPRKHIGSTVKQIQFDHAESLKAGGVLPSLVREKPCSISIGTLRRTRSPVHLARAGLMNLHGFAYSLHNLCLPTPSRFYLSKEPDMSKLTAHLPRVNGKCICPLCGDTRPDSWHYATTQCPFTDYLRRITQLATGNLLAGICSLGLFDPELPNIFVEWFKFHFSTLIGTDRVTLQNVTGTSPASPLPSWDGSSEWPLLLCPPATLLTLLRQPDRPEASLLLTVPAGRFPTGIAPRLATDKPSTPSRTLFDQNEVCLVLLRDTRKLPPPSDQALLELTAVISRFLLLGPTGVSLHWGGRTYPLDSLATEDGMDLLQETGLLQPAQASPSRSWNPSHSWLGILPAKLEGKTGKALALLTSISRQRVRDTLVNTILAGQLHTWNTTQSMITRYLKRQKLILKASIQQKPAPIFRRLYSSLGPDKATFPPSVDVNNKALAYLKSGGPMDREGFRSYAAQLGLGSKLLPSIWLAVLMQGVNRGKEELETIRGVSDVHGGLELALPVEYNMPYISPANRGRLLQAESRNRSEIRGLLDLPGIPKDTRTPLERCRERMKERLSRSRPEALSKNAPEEVARGVQSPHLTPDELSMEVSSEGPAPTTLEVTRTPLERCRNLMKKRLSCSRSGALDNNAPKEDAIGVQSPHSPPNGPLLMEVSSEGLASITLAPETLRGYLGR